MGADINVVKVRNSFTDFKIDRSVFVVKLICFRACKVYTDFCNKILHVITEIYERIQIMKFDPTLMSKYVKYQFCTSSRELPKG